MMNYPKVFEHYFRYIAIASALGNIGAIMSAISGHGIHLDLSFILWLWLSISIGQSKNYARITALVISVFSVCALTFSLVSPKGSASFFGLQFMPDQTGYYAILSLLIIIFAIPLSLFSSCARDQFRNENHGA